MNNSVLEDILSTCKPLIFLYIGNLLIDTFTPIYEVIPYLDVPMHIMGGYLSALCISRMFQLKKYKKTLSINTSSPYLSALIIISFVAVIAVGWEVYEYVASKIFAVQMQVSVFDTVKDLVLGMFGAFLYSSKEHHSIFLKR